MKRLAAAALILIFAAGCSSSDNTTQQTGSYDRTAMLTNWADNIIIPSFTAYQAKVNAMDAAVAQFTSSPDDAGLQSLRQAWADAYIAYEHVAIFAIGKADDLYLVESSNTYPADTDGIVQNIASGNYNLEQYGQFTRQGFPALDYLINGLSGTDSGIVNYYTGAEAAGYKQYLGDVTGRLKTTVDAILADWNNGYRETFINNSGTSVSSAVNKTTNNYVKDFEKNIRAPKIGIPAGLFSNGATFPEKVEGYYKNDISRELLVNAIQASQDFFNGKHFNENAYGRSLSDYLDAVGAVRDGQNLSAIINGQYSVTISKAQGLSNSLSQQVISDNSKMLQENDAMQQIVVYTKLDMLQALNIPIDYVDSDGD